MTRIYRRKTNRGSQPRSVFEKAMELVLNNKQSVRSVASELNIDRMTLTCFIMKIKKGGSAKAEVGYYGNRRIFSDDQEQALERYLLSASNVFFGLTPIEVRKLAYECALAFEIKTPKSWADNQIAGCDWFSLFMKRHPSLSVRKPEATSLARATSFNKNNGAEFYQKLKEVIERYNFGASDIWNVDETGVTTVQKPRNIVAGKGIKQVGAITSAERGSLVTVCGAVNAIGNSIPPMLIFPRKNFKNHFIRDGPVGCIDAANSSGWMNEEHFLEFMHHLVKHVKPTPETPILLLLDNHYSHLDLQVLVYAKTHGIVMLSFPPHTSHKLQPLDRTVYGPLKKYLSTAQDTWVRTHPGIPMSIYDIPGIVKEAWVNAFTTKNVMKGFEVAGIWPINPNVFDQSEFSPAYVTDRPEPEKVDEDLSMIESVSQREEKSDNPSNDKKDNLESETVYQYPLTSIEMYIEKLDKKIVRVQGDGHCLLHAIEICLIANGICNMDTKTLCRSLEIEIEENVNYYQAFQIERADLVRDIQQYIHDKRYNTDTGDMVLAAFCNALKIKAVVCKVGEDNTVTEITQAPRDCQKVKSTIWLTLEGNNASSHYNAVVSKMQPAIETSNNKIQTENHTREFDPEQVRPFPKAGPRKTKKKTTKRKSAILTDTPEKRK